MIIAVTIVLIVTFQIVRKQLVYLLF